MNLDGFDPLIAEWFERRFRVITEPQQLGWPIIRSGKDVLISAPTGSGKTLAAFLLCLDRLVREARKGLLAPHTQVVYVSPLKALSNDVHKNLDAPLAEIAPHWRHPTLGLEAQLLLAGLAETAATRLAP